VANQWIIPRLNRTGLPLLIARCALGGVCVYLGYLKVSDPMAFQKVLHEYAVLPERPRFILLKKVELMLLRRDLSPMMQSLASLAAASKY